MSKRTLLIGLACLLLGALSIWLYTGIGSQGPSNDALYTNKILLTTLSLANLLMLAVLGGVIGRDLFKAYLLGKKQSSGRFRSRLFWSFLGVGLLPNLFLFFGTVLIIQTSVDQWFSSPVEDITALAPRLKDAALEEAKKYNLLQTKRLARDLWEESSAGSPELQTEAFSAALAQAMAFEEIDRAFLVDARGVVLVEMAQRRVESTPDPKFCQRIFEEGEIRGWIGDDLASPYVRAGVLLPGGGAALVVDTPLSHALSTEAERILTIAEDFNHLRGQKKWVKVFFLSSFTLLALLVFFGSLWMGKSLAREITVPISLLVSGTQRMAGGESGVQVEYQAVDEIGELVQSFNLMAGELAKGRESLETANRDLNEARHDSETRRAHLETLLQNLSAGVIALRSDRSVRWANRAALRTLQLGPEPVTDQAGMGLFPEKSRANVEELVQQAEKGSVVSGEVTLEFGRKTRTVRMTAAPLQGQGPVEAGALLSFDDVTALLRAQHLAAWQEVARRMAHDIKNPLTPIQLSAQRMRKKAGQGGDNLVKIVESGTATIEEEVGVLKNLVDEFSRFSRLPQLDLKPHNLPRLIQSVINLYQGSYPGLKLELDWRLTEQILIIDPEQIRRALVNLLDNAVQAMNQNGEISIAVFPDELPGFLVLEVADTGPGIESKDLQRLFEPYYSTRKKGTGLGLAIVSRIVEEHGGRCGVQLNQPSGLVVSLHLPLRFSTENLLQPSSEQEVEA